MSITRFTKVSFLALSITLIVCLAIAPIAEAKLLPRAGGRPSAGTKTTAKQPAAAGSKVSTGVKFRADRHALIITFNNLSAAKKIDYQLTYQSQGRSEGAMGSVNPSVEPQSTATRELLFGTCSSGTCRYHPNITQAKLTITITLPSGKKVIKPYRLKV